jgi:hypothetical protein
MPFTASEAAVEYGNTDAKGDPMGIGRARIDAVLVKRSHSVLGYTSPMEYEMSVRRWSAAA